MLFRSYWNHTPMLLVTPQAANKTIGQGGFQEVEQMNLFKDMVCYQEEVRDPSRMAEVLNRVIEKAIRGSAPAQINVPRDYWTQVVDIELPPIVRLEKQGGGSDSISKAAKLLSEAKFPVILLLYLLNRILLLVSPILQLVEVQYQLLVSNNLLER